MSDPIPSLLDKIVDVGDRLCSAITTRQMDAIQDCLDERSELLVQLEQHEGVLTEPPRWEEVNDALARQHERIQDAFEEYREDLKTELEELTSYKQARSAYSEPDQPSRQILNREVRG